MAFAPYLQWRIYDLFSVNDDISLRVGGKFATKKLHQYFFEVSSEDVTPERPLYEADEGFIGSYVSASYYIPIKKWAFYVFASYGNNRGTANTESPLYVRDDNTSIGGGVVYTFWTSETMVDTKDTF